MKNYPDLSKLNDADHLLFDIGYSYAILFQVKGLLERMVSALPHSVLAEDAEQLLETLEDFNKGRLQYRNQIYDNAAEAAQRACRPTTTAPLK